MIWTNKQLKEALGQEVLSGIEGEMVQFNSKDLRAGDLFIALQGEAGNDGHNYAKDALDRGAAAVIVDRNIENLDASRVIMVENTYRALLKLAEYKRERSKAKFIGITGSSGKTSTKEFTRIILQAYGKVFASRGNFNNEIGVPLDLASMPDDIDYAVIEMGMNHPNEIRTLTKLTRPHIAVITNIGPAHIGFFDSIEGIVKAKAEIFEGLTTGGTVILPRDSTYYEMLKGCANALAITGIKSFGVHPEADSVLEKYECHPQPFCHPELVSESVSFLRRRESNSFTDCLRLKYRLFGKTLDVTRSLLSEHFALNIAASLLVAESLNKDIEVLVPKIKEIEAPEGRGKIFFCVRNGVRNTILSDYYNANPASVRAALKYFGLIPHPNKLLILGNMGELGKDEIAFHQELAPDIVGSGAKRVALVGDLASHIAERLPSEIEVMTFTSTDQLIAELDRIIKDNEFILIKGSKSTKLSKLAEIFKESSYAL